MVNWKKVGMGVAAAAVGSGVFGAIHFMFLAPQMGVGDVMGIPLNVVLPFLVGTLGFIGVYGFGKKMGETMKDVIKFGSAAIVGVGVAQYAGWVTPTTVVPARAIIPTRRLTATPLRRAPAAATLVAPKLI